MLRRIQELIKAGESFAYETTLSGRSQIVWIRKAREQGYRVVMYYIYINDVAINVNRVNRRVRQGGHDVPGEDIRRRYGRSLENFFQNYQTVCDTIEVYDNSDRILALVARKPTLEAEYEIFDSAVWNRLMNEGGAREPKYHVTNEKPIGALTGAEIIAIEQAERYGTDMVIGEKRQYRLPFA